MLPCCAPVHSQYTKRLLTALNHHYPSRTLLEQYQRFTRLSTTASDPDNDPVVKWSGGRRASAGPRKQAFRRRTQPLFGSVAVAVLTAPTTVSVSYTGTTTLTFTATTDQPPGGGGLSAEIFEKIMPGGIQNLGGCNSRTTSFKGPAVSGTCAGHVCRHIGVHQQHVPAGRAGRELQPGDTSASGDLPGRQRDATTNTNCPCPATSGARFSTAPRGAEKRGKIAEHSTTWVGSKVRRLWVNRATC